MDNSMKINYRKEFKRENMDSYKENRKSFKKRDKKEENDFVKEYKDKNNNNEPKVTKTKDITNMANIPSRNLDKDKTFKSKFNTKDDHLKWFCKKTRAKWYEDNDKYEFITHIDNLVIRITNMEILNFGVTIEVYSNVKYKIPFIYNRIVNVVNKTIHFMDTSILDRFINSKPNVIKIIDSDRLEEFKQEITNLVPKDKVKEYGDIVKNGVEFNRLTEKVTKMYPIDSNKSKKYSNKKLNKE
jgi:hypothetical protein